MRSTATDKLPATQKFMFNLTLKKSLLTIAFLTLFSTFYGFEAHNESDEFETVAAEMVMAAESSEEAGFTLLEEGEYQISAYDELMQQISREEGTDWRLMSAIAYHESRFTADIVSNRGARGLMQIMPVVARHFQVEPEKLLDPETNVRLANQLLNQLDKMMQIPAGTPYEDRMSLILAAYNGGIGHISDARRLARHHGENPNSWEDVSRYLELKADPAYYEQEVVRYGRFTGFKQTNAYVRDVMNRYRCYCTIAQKA